MFGRTTHFQEEEKINSPNFKSIPPPILPLEALVANNRSSLRLGTSSPGFGPYPQDFQIIPNQCDTIELSANMRLLKLIKD